MKLNLLVIICLFVCVCCKVHRNVSMEQQTQTTQTADSNTGRELFHVEQIHDSVHTYTNRVIYIFDTIYQSVPTDGGVDVWARQQNVRAVIVESSEQKGGAQSVSQTQYNDSTRASMNMDQQSAQESNVSKVREVDNGLYIAGVICFALFLASILLYIWKYRV